MVVRVKPKAPRWLTESFAHGVDEREAMAMFSDTNAYGCWLAQFDTHEVPCTDKLERAHIIGRQRVESVMWEQLRHMEIGDLPTMPSERNSIVLLAAWDPRNARIACEGHHRRFDSHSTPPLFVPYNALPEHVLEFIEDYGLELELEKRFAPHPEDVVV
jgi:hypothetical protein